MDTEKLLRSLQRWLRAGKVGELAVKAGGGEVTPCGGVRFGCEAFSSTAPVDCDLSTPTPIVCVKIDAKIARASRFGRLSAVGDVLGRSAGPQVYPAVIQCVVIDVVDHFTNLRAGDFSMQQEKLSLAIGSGPGDDVMVNTAFSFHGHDAPIPGHQKWHIALVNLNGMAADEHDCHQLARIERAPDTREVGAGAEGASKAPEETTHETNHPKDPAGGRPE
jgi:hypothetical protein